MLRKHPRSSGCTACGDLYNHSKGSKCQRLSDMAKCLTPWGRAAASVTSFSALCLECVGEGLEREARMGTRHGYQCSGQTSQSAVSAKQNYCLPTGICFFLPSLLFLFCFLVFGVLYNKASGSAGLTLPAPQAWSKPPQVNQEPGLVQQKPAQARSRYVCLILDTDSAPLPNGLALVCFLSIRKKFLVFPDALSVF